MSTINITTNTHTTICMDDKVLQTTNWNRKWNVNCVVVRMCNKDINKVTTVYSIVVKCEVLNYVNHPWVTVTSHFCLKS